MFRSRKRSTRFAAVRSCATAGVFALILASCGTNGSDEQTDGDESDDANETADSESIEPTTVTVQTIQGADTFVVNATEDYAEAVTEATDGAIDFEFNYSMSLVPGEETPDAMADGIVDLYPLAPVLTPELFPVSNWLSEIVFYDETVPSGNMAGTAASQEWSIENEALVQEYESQGIKLLGSVLLHPTYHLLCTTSLNSADDLEGLSVRVPGEAVAAEAELLGMEPVFLSGEEVYEAFQRGVVDCVAGGGPFFGGSGLYDTGTHQLQNVFLGLELYLTVGLDFWEGLSDDAQAVMLEHVPYWNQKLLEHTWLEEQAAYEEALERGVEFSEVDDEVATMLDDYRTSLLEDHPDRAPDGMDDPSEALERRDSLIEEWQTIVRDDMGFPTYDNFSQWFDDQPNWDEDLDLSPFTDRLEDRLYN